MCLPKIGEIAKDCSFASLKIEYRLIKICLDVPFFQWILLPKIAVTLLKIAGMCKQNVKDWLQIVKDPMCLTKIAVDCTRLVQFYACRL